MCFTLLINTVLPPHAQPKLSSQNVSGASGRPCYPTQRPSQPGTLQVNAAPVWWLSKQCPPPSSGASTAEWEIIFVSSQGRATGEKRSAVLEGLVYISKENASASESHRVLATDGAERP